MQPDPKGLFCHDILLGWIRRGSTTLSALVTFIERHVRIAWLDLFSVAPRHCILLMDLLQPLVVVRLFLVIIVWIVVHLVDFLFLQPSLNCACLACFQAFPLTGITFSWTILSLLLDSSSPVAVPNRCQFQYQEVDSIQVRCCRISSNLDMFLRNIG